MKTMPYNLSIATTPTLRTALSENASLTKLHDKKSVALTSGKNVNTSYDNSTLFFKDMRLSERARGLTSVLDGLSNIVSTLSTAGKSIDSISSFLANAKAAANSALDGTNYISQITGKNYTLKESDLLTDMPKIQAGDEIMLRTGDADKMEAGIKITRDMTLADANITEGEEFKIKIGGEDWITLKVIDEDMKISDFFGQISEQTESEAFAFEILEDKLTLKTSDRSGILVEGSIADALGFDSTTTHKIKIENGWTVQDLLDAVSAIDGITAAIDSNDHLQITSIYGDDLVIADFTGEAAASIGIAGVDDGGSNTGKTYADQFNEALRQINSIVKDSTFNGLNLLEGDSIRAVFDEQGTSFRTVNGVKLDTESLGLSFAEHNWENEDDIRAAFDAIEKAMYQVQRASDKFERASRMVQSRETFLEGMSNTCALGAEMLTAADLNTVSTEILAIETQKQLVNQVIGITLDTSSSILALFK